jgi:hypothetical protein
LVATLPPITNGAGVAGVRKVLGDPVVETRLVAGLKFFRDVHVIADESLGCS